MKIFIDTGSVKEVESLVPLGIIDGVTTNPSLMAKEGGNPRDIIKKIAQLVKGPTSAEVVATEHTAMIAEGRELAKIDEHVVVKIPFTREGIQAIKALSGEGIKINTTLIFSAVQAMFAAKAGASYVSPFVGRLDDIASDGMTMVQHIVDIFGQFNITTEILVASVRSPMHILEAARMGADICTCPAAVIEQSFKHPLTDIGLEKFLADYKKSQAQAAGAKA
jgi:transaldolase